MHPILVDFGFHDLPLLGPTHLFLPTYGALFAFAAVLAWWWFTRRARSLGVPRETAFNLGFYALLAGILGAKAALILVEWRFYLLHPAAILGSFRAAGVVMGGVLAGAVTFVLYARHHGFPVLRLGDAAAAPLALAQAIGRVGCFSAGCCYGKPASPGSHFAVTFHDPAAAAQTGVPLGVPLIPTQLLHLTANLVLAVLLTWMWRRRPRPDGTVMWTYVLLYGIARGTIEFWRGDTIRGVYFGGMVSTSQILSAAAILLAAVMLIHGRLRAAEDRAG